MAGISAENKAYRESPSIETGRAYCARQLAVPSRSNHILTVELAQGLAGAIAESAVEPDSSLVDIFSLQGPLRDFFATHTGVHGVLREPLHFRSYYNTKNKNHSLAEAVEKTRERFEEGTLSSGENFGDYFALYLFSDQRLRDMVADERSLPELKRDVRFLHERVGRLEEQLRRDRFSDESSSEEPS